MPQIAKKPEESHHTNARKNDQIAKEKMERDYNARMRAAKSDITVGDEVLLKQRKENKFTTLCHKTRYKVIRRRGSAVVIKGRSGDELMRNVSQFKKLKVPKVDKQKIKVDGNEQVRSGDPCSSSSQTGQMRQRTLAASRITPWKSYPKRMRSKVG